VNSSETVFQATSLPLSLATDSVGNLHGIIYAQPLYISKVPTHPNADVLFVATEENYIYALSGNNLSSTPLWNVNLNGTNEGAVPDGDLSGGTGCNNIKPEVGITGTPVIDNNASSNQPNVLYAVSVHYNSSTGVTTQRLNAITIVHGYVHAAGQVQGTVLPACHYALSLIGRV
jgi:hypothetical protein